MHPKLVVGEKAGSIHEVTGGENVQVSGSTVFLGAQTANASAREFLAYIL